MTEAVAGAGGGDRTLERLARRLLRAVQAGDRAGAGHRVERLRQLMPKAGTERLQNWLVRRKCLHAGAVAALSSAVPRLPLVGAGAGALLGDLADRDSLIHLQADLVLEIFALYEVRLPASAERMAVLAIAATQLTQGTVGEGLIQAVEQASRKVFGGFLLRRALPLADIAAQTASSIATTYAIGQRAAAIARFKDAPLTQWPDLLRAVSGIDERTLARFAGAATRTAFEQVADSTRGWMERLGRIVPMSEDVRHAAGSMWGWLDPAISPGTTTTGGRDAPSPRQRPRARKPRQTEPAEGKKSPRRRKRGNPE